MKKRCFASLLSAALLLLSFTGCKPDPADVSSGSEPVRKAQLVAALNPILVFDDGSNAIAYNDVKDAMKSDRDTASLASLYNNTGWQWSYRQPEAWKGRATHALTKWKNGMGASPKETLNAYSFIEDGTISMMSYAAQSIALTTYQNEPVPDFGLLLSVSGGEEEALCYTVEKDGHMTVPAGTVTAIESVAGVKTGSLAEDGTERKAVVRLIVNSREIWSGQLINSAAAQDGTAVTELSYPAFEAIPVTAGDLVFFSVALNAEVNTETDVTTPPPDHEDDGRTDGVESAKPDSAPSSSAPQPEAPSEGKPGTVSLLDGYDSRFMIIRAAGASNELLKEISVLSRGMEKALNAEQFYKTDDYKDDGGYEILMGLTNRPQSAAPMRELMDARTNHAADFIIRMAGKKLVFAASNEYAMSLAVEYFLNTYCKDDRGEIPGNLNYISRPAMQSVMLGNHNIASFVIRVEKYPSYMTVLAAQDLQRQIMRQTGYRPAIATDVKKSAFEIAVGPVSAAKDGPKNLLANQNDYKISMNGNRLSVEGGSTYAANEGVQALVEELKTRTSLPNGYTKSGTHSTGSYSLSGGYGLKWNDEFNDTKMTRKWFASTDTTQSFDGSPQIRNGIFGEDYFLRDGCLVEVTRKRQDGPGYNAVRLTTQNLMNFRYGFLELRLIMATNNGACSAIWMNGESLNQIDLPEIDINENYGIDAYQPNLHSWPKDGEHWQMWEHNSANGLNEPNWVFPAAGEHFYDTFHYLGMEWTEEYIAFYLDGQITKFVDIIGPKYDVLRQSVILKLANGVAFNMGYGMNGKGIPPYFLDDVNDFYEEQVIDFVRLYQKNDRVSKLRAK